MMSLGVYLILGLETTKLEQKVCLQSGGAEFDRCGYLPGETALKHMRLIGNVRPGIYGG